MSNENNNIRHWIKKDNKGSYDKKSNVGQTDIVCLKYSKIIHLSAWNFQNGHSNQKYLTFRNIYYTILRSVLPTQIITLMATVGLWQRLDILLAIKCTIIQNYRWLTWIQFWNSYLGHLTGHHLARFKIFNSFDV